MTRRAIRSLGRDESGAVSPLYAVAILTLVAMAGVGFDYGRMTALDTELQNAADQAALAAATQLDGGDDAMDRAQSAARDAFASSDSPFVNETRFANDDQGRPITALTFKFYESYTSDPDAMGTEVPEGGDQTRAKVVEVTVDARHVRYALTPLVGAFGADAIGRAAATLQSATCNVPPLMFCSPSRSFPGPEDVGKGIPLHMKKNQAGSTEDAEDPLWVAGNFGFLDIDYGITGNPNRTLGLNTTASPCFGDPIESRPGFRTTEAKALNTRFDFYESPLNNCDKKTGDFCPAANVRKNWVRVENRSAKVSEVPDLSCDPNQKNKFDWVRYDNIPEAENRPSNPGYPCDSAGCTAFGDGDWGAESWFQTQHPGEALDSVPDLDGNGSISRYEVYDWEQKDTSRTRPVKIGYFPRDLSGLKPEEKIDVKLYCSYPTPIDQAPYVPNPPSPQKDRRLLTVAAVDCTNLRGRAEVDILRWVDIFLVTPADKTNGTDEDASGRAFYGEIVGPARLPGGGSGFQYYSRKKAVLIR